LDTRRLSKMKIISRVLFIATFFGFALAGDWDCSTTSGVFTQSTDCTVNSQVVVSGSLNITGIPDANGVLPKIIGGGSNRLFKVERSGELTIKSLHLTEGRTSETVCNSPYTDCGGGGIHLAGGTFNAIGATMSNCRAYHGGFILAHNGSSVGVENSTFSDNYAKEFGGALHIIDMSQFKLHYSLVKNNTALSKGGGAYTKNANMTILGSQFHLNHAAYYGGGMRTDGNSQILIEHSKIYNNTAGNSGAGIHNFGDLATMTIKQSSLMRNRAGSAAAVYNGFGATLFMVDSKVYENQGTGSSYGGGAFMGSKYGKMSIVDSAITNNYVETKDGDIIYTYYAVNFLPVSISLVNVDFGKNTTNTSFGGNCPNDVYCGTNNCSFVPTVCAANGYSDAICTTRQNADEGVICTAWTTCIAGQKIAANGTSSADRTCVACPTGKFSTASNQNTCTNWTTCNATTEIESSAGSTTADRVCATASSPSPAGSSPSPAENTSTTAAPNKLSADSRYQPQLYLCGVLMVSICFGL
jgi:hypothetical protein